MNRREFLHVLAAAAAGGMALDSPRVLGAWQRPGSYDIAPFGNVSLLHFTDCHAQLLPNYFREPDMNLGAGNSRGKPPHLVGEKLLREFGIPAGTREAHAFTHLDFVQAARPMAWSAALPIWRPSSRGCARCAPVRCSSTAATLGKEVRSAFGCAVRIWWTRPSCWGWT